MSSESSRDKPVDIIDLDRYMRVAVMPSRQQGQVQRCGDLVVDAGGVERMPAIQSSGDASYSCPPQVRAPAPFNKRFSHDSGVSDSSYRKRRSRRCKRRSESSESRLCSQRNEGSSAMTDFRTNCEQTLLEQQKQIERLAALCDRLQQPNTDKDKGTNGARPHDKRENTKKTIKPKKMEAKYIATSSSDTSSSSPLGTRDVRRKAYKSESCKTYKIMMDRLDDLSRVITSRRPLAAAPPVKCSTILVSNKVVATESDKFGKVLAPTVRNNNVSDRREDCRRSTLGSMRETHALGVSPPQTLSIGPVQGERHNIVTESVVHGSCSSGDLPSNFYLDDPIRFHAQGRTIQAFHASAKYRSPVENNPAEPSLCGLCRTYWRALRNSITNTFGAYL